MNDLCSSCGCEMNEHDRLDGHDKCDDCVEITVKDVMVPFSVIDPELANAFAWNKQEYLHRHGR